MSFLSLSIFRVFQRKMMAITRLLSEENLGVGRVDKTRVGKYGEEGPWS
jgi:hypothetical protein